MNRQGKNLIEKIEELGLGIMNGNKWGDKEEDIYRKKWKFSDKLCDMQCGSMRSEKYKSRKWDRIRPQTYRINTRKENKNEEKRK